MADGLGSLLRGRQELTFLERQYEIKSQFDGRWTADDIKPVRLALKKWYSIPSLIFFFKKKIGIENALSGPDWSTAYKRKKEAAVDQVLLI